MLPYPSPLPNLETELFKKIDCQAVTLYHPLALSVYWDDLPRSRLLPSALCAVITQEPWEEPPGDNDDTNSTSFSL